MSDPASDDDVLSSTSSFLVGQSEEKITENKFLLSQSSKVLEAMLCGELKEKCNIKVPDIEPDAFRTMLKFINGEKVKFTNMDHAAKVCYAADKYDIPQLKRECTEYIFPCSVDDVFVALDCGVLYNIDLLKDVAMKIVQQDTYRVLSSKQFLTISRVALQQIVQEDYLDVISEMDLYVAVLNWAKHQCLEEGKSCDRKNIRDVLGDILQHIRFLTMNQGEIINNGKLVLTADEIKMLLEYINKDDDKELIDSLCCNTEKRKQLEIKLPTAKVIYMARFIEGKEVQIVKSNNIISQPLSQTSGNIINFYSVTIPTRSSLYADYYKMYFEEVVVNLKSWDGGIVASGSYRGKTKYDTELRIQLLTPGGSYPQILYNSTGHNNMHYLQMCFKTKDIHYYPIRMCNFSSVFSSMKNAFSFVVGIEYSY